jgi:hypothetical protein
MGFTINNGVLQKYSEEAGITEVIIPDGVTSIGDSAFKWCSSLTSITIPEGVTSIGDSAFEYCSSLTSIVIPTSVTSFGKEAFSGCSSLTGIVIPTSVISIGKEAFCVCSSLTSIVIPEGVTSIGDSAFFGCSSLTSIVIPTSVTSFGKEAFSDCSSLTSITIPNSVTSIGKKAFSDCSSLTSIVIPNSVTSIGNKAFSDCSGLTSIVIPEGVTSIGDSAFFGCSSLTSITIPEGITSIGDSAFFGCSSLTGIVIPTSVISIGKEAFSGCKSLTSITIPEGVTSIGDSAFEYCSSLTSITIPNSVTSIGKEAFYGCSSLTSIIIPEGVTSIGNSAFFGCSSLTGIVIPNSVTSIGERAFGDCSSLTSITISEGVTSIGDSAFDGCSSLSDLTVPDHLAKVFIPNGVKKINQSEFWGKSHLKSIIIPDSVTSIEDFAFYGCSSLTSIIMPNSVTSIGRDVFEGCSKLTEIINLLSLIRNGCKVQNTTMQWLLENLWKSPEYLKETAEVYLFLNAKKVKEICEARLLVDCENSANFMLEMIGSIKDNAPALKNMANFALICGNQLPREKLLAIHEALQKVSAKSAMKLLEKAVQNEEGLRLEDATGHLIEAVCLERFNETLMDRDLKAYGISPKLFTGVRYRGTETLAPGFVVKCAIFPYMQKLKELPCRIGGYATDFVEVEPDSQIDEIAAALEREDLQALLGDLIFKFDPFKWRLLLPYCRYGSGEQMNALNPWVRKWAVWGDYSASGRQFIIVLHGAMMLSDTREAMLLIEKWGLLDEYARIRNTTADVLRDTFLTEFNLDADGSKRYDLGNTVIAASLGSDLSVSLFNETTRKEVKSLPKRGADPEKHSAASTDLADLKKNIKKAVKSRVDQLKNGFVSGAESKTIDWKASYTNNYVLRRIASLLIWQWTHKKDIRHFMMTIDGHFIDCNEQLIEIPDKGVIKVAHPVEFSSSELECWQNLLAEKQIAQPFVQMFEPICDLDPSVVVSQYEGIKLPMFLLRGLAKEGIHNTGFMYDYEGSTLSFGGKAISIYASSEGVYYTERGIPFDEIVELKKVNINGTPRAVNHEIYALDKALIENRVRNGDIPAVQAFSRAITAKTIQHLIDVSIQAEKMEVTAWLMNYKNDHFPYTFADLEL